MTDPLDLFAEKACNDVLPRDIFDPEIMLPRCERCPLTAACQQQAADAPFVAEGVWGGLVLPRDRDLLPPPTEQRQYEAVRYHEITDTNRKGGGRPPWWAEIGRNSEPFSGRHSNRALARP